MNVGETDCITFGLVPEVKLRFNSVKRLCAVLYAALFCKQAFR